MITWPQMFIKKIVKCRTTITISNNKIQVKAEMEVNRTLSYLVKLSPLPDSSVFFTDNLRKKITLQSVNQSVNYCPCTRCGQPLSPTGPRSISLEGFRSDAELASSLHDR